jgi:hypothetical protein
MSDQDPECFRAARMQVMEVGGKRLPGTNRKAGLAFFADETFLENRTIAAYMYY